MAKSKKFTGFQPPTINTPFGPIGPGPGGTTFDPEPIDIPGIGPIDIGPIDLPIPGGGGPDLPSLPSRPSLPIGGPGFAPPGATPARPDPDPQGDSSTRRWGGGVTIIPVCPPGTYRRSDGSCAPMRFPGDPGGGIPNIPPPRRGEPPSPPPSSGVGPCPPGTRCVGITLGENICIGPCVEMEGGDVDPQGFAPTGGMPARAPQGGTGTACACATGTSLTRVGQQCACCLPSGGLGRLNKSRYIVKRDRCGPSDDPNNYALVNPGTKCVPRRSMNVANPRAARRAISRLSGFHRMMKRTEKSLRKLAR